jgi:hypothetical protein
VDARLCQLEVRENALPKRDDNRVGETWDICFLLMRWKPLKGLTNIFWPFIPRRKRLGYRKMTHFPGVNAWATKNNLVLGINAWATKNDSVLRRKRLGKRKMIRFPGVNAWATEK